MNPNTSAWQACNAVSYTHLIDFGFCHKIDYWNTIIDLVAKAKVYPVLHGSAMFNIGINELLDAISSFILPPASVSNRLSAYLYKIEHDPVSYTHLDVYKRQLQRYCGFGGLKCILNPAKELTDAVRWAKSEMCIRDSIRAVRKSDVLNDYEVCRYMQLENGLHADVYALEIIIPVAFRVNTYNTHLFRTWLVGKALSQEKRQTYVMFIQNGKAGYC